MNRVPATVFDPLTFDIWTKNSICGAGQVKIPGDESGLRVAIAPLAIAASNNVRLGTVPLLITRAGC